MSFTKNNKVVKMKNYSYLPKSRGQIILSMLPQKSSQEDSCNIKKPATESVGAFREEDGSYELNETAVQDNKNIITQKPVLDKVVIAVPSPIEIAGSDNVGAYREVLETGKEGGYELSEDVIMDFSSNLVQDNNNTNIISEKPVLENVETAVPSPTEMAESCNVGASREVSAADEESSVSSAAQDDNNIIIPEESVLENMEIASLPIEIAESDYVGAYQEVPSYNIMEYVAVEEGSYELNENNELVFSSTDTQDDNNITIPESVLEKVEIVISSPIEMAESDYVGAYQEVESSATEDDNNNNILEESVIENVEIAIPSSHNTTKRIRKNSRWSKRNESSWARNVSKKRRYDGLTYETKKGVMPAKKPKLAICTTCRFKCNENFPDNEREQLCSRYWNLSSYQRQKDFILKHVKQNDPVRVKRGVLPKDKRTCSRSYFLPKDSVNVRVCQKFFEKTLCISNGPINKAFFESNDGIFTGTDQRGKHTPHNKTKDVDLNVIRSHIESFPAMESHYCRASSKRKYLDPKLSIAKLYELYEIECKKNQTKPVSSTVYRNVFCNEYNLATFVPRKDQCALCRRHDEERKKGPISQELYELHNEHIKRKNEAQQAKQIDKDKSNNDTHFLSATFDLQSVLQLPASEESLVYYKRKLCVYNLTIYESKLPNDAHCFVWMETDGKRGSSEIGSAVKKWIDHLPDGIKHLSLFSDTCGGQNRNQHIAALLLFIVETTNIEVIEQKFLESGHSEMEVDSMHSAIETEKKFKSCFTMTDWINIMKNARSNRNRKNAKPYNVTQLKYVDFYDLKDLSEKLILNRVINSDGERVNWLKIKMLKYSKWTPSVIHYSYDYNETNYKMIYVSRNSKRTGNPQNIRNNNEIILKRCYNEMLPLSFEKKKDLLQLCEKLIIPEELHPWYQSIPASSKVRDCVPEPSIDEDEEIEEFCSEKTKKREKNVGKKGCKETTKKLVTNKKASKK